MCQKHFEVRDYFTYGFIAKEHSSIPYLGGNNFLEISGAAFPSQDSDFETQET